ncbi:MAG: hypothetical protein IT182_17170 [Acidobacteria bacterium]|nr:hypothetical protein [Acidobacteriota bacterium]
MSRPCAVTRTSTVATGLLFLLSGVVLWAGSQGWYSIHQAIPWWPATFIFPAVHRLTSPPPERSLFAGVAWLGAGALLVAANLDYIQLRFSTVVAIFLLVAGARLLWQAWQPGRQS